MAKEIQKRVTLYLNGKEVEGTIGNLRKKTRELNRDINELTPGTQAYINKAKELKTVNSEISKHRTNVKGINTAYASAQGGLSKFKNLALGVFAGGGLLGLATGVLTGIKEGIGGIIIKNKEYEKSLSSLRSLTGATTADMKFYNKEAKDIGANTTLSASQAVDAFKLIGSARPELLKNKEALASVTREAITLAEAAEIDLSEAAQSLAGTLNGLNLEASDSNRVINALAAGSKEGAAGIVEQTEALDAFAPLAASENIRLEENIGLIETLAEKNIKGSEAGTKLRNVITALATAKALPPEALEQLEKFGVNTDIVSDSSLTLEERLTELAKIQGDNTALVKVFGKENLVAGATILQNVDTVKKYTDAVTGTNVATEQAIINTDNLEGDNKTFASTWEATQLLFQKGTGIIRLLVQGFTNWLKSINNIIIGFQNLDFNRIIGGFLGFIDTLTLGYLNLGEFSKKLIEYSDLVDGVIDKVQEQARGVDILTTALGDNNKALASNTLSEEESKKAKEENEKIIAQLKKQYPELTAEIDLQNASNEQLNQLTKDVTASLIKQTIEEAKQIKTKALLNKLVENSIKLAKAESDGKDGVLGFFSEIEDLKNERKQIDNELNNISETFKKVENDINGMNINFGADYDANVSLVAKAESRLLILKGREKIFGSNEKLEAEIKAQKQIIDQGVKNKQDALNELIEIEKKGNKLDNDNAGSGAESNGEGYSTSTDKASKEQAQLLAKQLQDVEKLKEAIDSFREEAKNAERIDLLQTDEAKELEKLQQAIDKKFSKEIDNAKELAVQKGEIGVTGKELLNSLELIKEKDLQNGIESIQAEYADKRLESRKADVLAENETVLKAAQTTANLEAILAQEKVNAINENDIEAKRTAQEQLVQALKNRLATEEELELNALLNKYDQKLVSDEEYQLQKHLIEDKYRQQADQLDAETTEKQKARKQAVIDAAKQLITEGSQVIADFTQLQVDKQIEKDEASKEAELEKLEDRRIRGLVNDAQYEESKEKLETKYAKKKAEEQMKAAKAQRAAALIQAGINTAVAVSAGMASPAVPPFPSAIAAGILGAAQIALISSQPIAQFKDGGYNGKHRVTGATDNKQYNANYIGSHRGGMLPSTPSLVLASEKGPEYFVPNHLLTNPAVADSVRFIEAVRVGQFANGGYNNPVSTDSVPTTNDQASKLTQEQQQINVMMANAIDRLSNTIDKGLPVLIGDDKVNDITNKQTEIDTIVNR